MYDRNHSGVAEFHWSCATQLEDSLRHAGARRSAHTQRQHTAVSKQTGGVGAHETTTLQVLRALKDPYQTGYPRKASAFLGSFFLFVE